MRAIPTSRAYWELRAEQVLNRVFAPEAPIDIEPTTASEPAGATALNGGSGASSDPGAGGDRATIRLTALPLRTATAGAAAARAGDQQHWWGRLQQQPTLLLAGLGLAMTLMAGTTLVGLALWQQGQQAIRQERNLLLVERLRALGPGQAAAAGSAPATAADPNAAAATTGNSAEPPPPPSEPWMKELATLPASSAPAANVLRVPMSGQVSSPAPAAGGAGGGTAPAGGTGPAAGGDVPQLVGVVQVPGRPGSAIFQVGGSSTSAATGEAIGSSGWRLRSASGDSAVIESNGVQRRLSISSGL